MNAGSLSHIAGPDGLDQVLCRHPDEFLERPVEAAILDHLSPEIRDQHLIAAAYEPPLTLRDEEFFGSGLEDAGQALVLRGELRKAGRGLIRGGPVSPHPTFRSAPPRPGTSR